MIHVDHLTFQYDGAPAPAVQDIAFTVETGQIYGFLGPSGAGKSTVQQILIQLLPLQQGDVRYDDVALADLDKSFFNHIGVSFEHPNLFPRLTGLENLQAYLGLYDGDKEDPHALLERVGLGDAKGKKAEDYSKGMKQRLVFARALLHRPKFLFLDEPTSGLDPATAHIIMDMIDEQRQRGATILLTTHNMLVADALCDVIGFLHDGAIVAQDAPRDLKLQYGTRAVEVELRQDGKLAKETLFLDDDNDKRRLAELTQGDDVETLHTQEATLEQIFIKLTGRGLS